MECSNPKCRKGIVTDRSIVMDAQVFCSRDCVFVKIEVMLEECALLLKLLRKR